MGENRTINEFSITGLIYNRLKKVPDNVGFCFWSSIITFFIIHFYIFSDKFFNNDDGIFHNGGAGVTSGRWLKNFICGFSSEWSAVWLIGVLCAIYFAVAVCFIVSIFEIKNRVSIILIAVSMMSFPILADTTRFIVCIDSYIFSLMLVCMGCYLGTKYKFGFILAGIAFAFSMGIYQAYFCYAIPVFMLYSIRQLYCGKNEVKSCIIQGVKEIVALGLGLLFYKLILDFCLAKDGVVLGEYMGINDMFHFGISDIILRIKKAYLYFGAFYGNRVWSIYIWRVVAFWGILFLGAILGIFFLWRETKTVNKAYLRLLCIAILLLLLPLGCNSIMIMSERVHELMIYGFSFPMVLAVILVEDLQIKKDKSIKNILAGVTSLLLLGSVVVLGYAGIVSTNAAYEKIDSTYEAAYAYVTKLSTRIEMTDGYYEGIPVAFVGQTNEDSVPQVENKEVQNKLMLIPDIPGTENAVSVPGMKKMLAFYQGVQYSYIEGEQLNALTYNSEVKAMPNYPMKESVKVIDGILVVKFSE